MNTNGHGFLEALASFPPESFEGRFLKISTKLELPTALNGDELNLLFDATFFACLCNIAFNGLGGCRGKIKPEQEGHRLRLERQFMASQDKLFQSPGWKGLPEARRESVRTICLRVLVRHENLAS
jgi:hypothetical protein